MRDGDENVHWEVFWRPIKNSVYVRRWCIMMASLRSWAFSPIFERSVILKGDKDRSSSVARLPVEMTSNLESTCRLLGTTRHLGR